MQLNLSRIIGTFALVWSASSAQAVPISYVHDDGGAETQIGITGAFGDFEWANQFFAQPGGTTISSISVAIGTDSSFGHEDLTGAPLTLRLYDDVDNDGTPNDLLLLASVVGSVSNWGLDVFNVFDIPNTVVAGSFFISAAVSSPDGATFPARLDQSSDAEASWLRSSSPDIAWVMSRSAGFAGNWLLRAEGSAEQVPVAPSLPLVGLGLAALLWGRRQQQTKF